ncbi:MAG: DMT family transporter [Chloroflexi bacterium]|nr:DMT family transporter [Chloroflexota bacterium]
MTDVPAEVPKAANIHWTGWAIALGSSVAFSISTPIAKAAILLGMAPATLLVLRLLITTLLLFSTTLLTEPVRLRIDRRHLMFCILAGLANGVGMLAYFSSLTRLDSSIAAMIFSISPLVVLGLLALRGERVTPRNGARLALGLGGVYLLIGPGGQVDLSGVALVMVSVLAVPFQLVIMQWYLQAHDPRTVTLYMVTTMMAVAIGWWLAQGAEWHDPGWRGWLLVLTLAFFSTYLARLLLFLSVRKIGGGQTGLLAPLETLLTVIWSTIFLNERLTTVQWLGGLLILISAGLAVNVLGRAQRRKQT